SYSNGGAHQIRNRRWGRINYSLELPIRAPPDVRALVGALDLHIVGQGNILGRMDGSWCDMRIEVIDPLCINRENINFRKLHLAKLRRAEVSINWSAPTYLAH